MTAKCREAIGWPALPQAHTVGKTAGLSVGFVNGERIGTAKPEREASAWTRRLASTTNPGDGRRRSPGAIRRVV